jgi:hypothetical protein
MQASHKETKRAVSKQNRLILMKARAQRPGDGRLCGVSCPSPRPFLGIQLWRALRESNPCFSRERAASWTARRRAPTEASRHIEAFGLAGKPYARSWTRTSGMLPPWALRATRSLERSGRWTGSPEWHDAEDTWSAGSRLRGKGIRNCQAGRGRPEPVELSRYDPRGCIAGAASSEPLPE